MTFIVPFRALACIAIFTVWGCDRPTAVGFSVTLQPGDGDKVPSYRVVVATSDDEVVRITCPTDGTVGKVNCTSNGVVIKSIADGDEITVKARGYAFTTTAVTAREIANRGLILGLKLLPKPEVTTGYRTGFDSLTGEEDFLKLAVITETELGTAYSVKIYIAQFRTEPQVYFQNTKRYPLHYDFARDVLGLAQTRAQFELLTYRGENRDALAGTIVYRPSLAFVSKIGGGELSAPITLEFFPSDDLSADQALQAHRLLEERLGFVQLASGTKRLVYVPAGSRQESEIVTASGIYYKRDALWSRLVEVYAGINEQTLNPGVAYGTLYRLTPEQLAQSVVSYRDILVLTRLPNDLPLVGGTLTEELQTPLAHVNVAARARGTPNASLRSAGTDARVAPLLGQLVRYEVTSAGFTLTAATLEEAESFWNARKPEKLVPVSDLTYKGLPGFDSLDFGDAIGVGAKAANLAELRKLIGDQAPFGFAVPFSAYDEYMRTNLVTRSLCDDARDDCISESRATVVCDVVQVDCQRSAQASETFFEYADNVLSDDSLAGDTTLREATLDGLKYLVRHGTVDAIFGTALDARVAAIFGDRQVRLRSSANTEDLPGFSGAGLYESVSAMASGSDRASLEIRKVWASVWTWRAFEERAFWNVDQWAVRMGVAVSPAFDDELVNGVVITRNISNPGAAGLYLNFQLGEVSVTNPAGGELPEVLTIVPAPDGRIQVARQRYSSLSPEAPLLTDDEVATIADAAYRIAEHFAPLYRKPANTLAFDIEFKLAAPNRQLVIKQVRPF